jgi:beta-galactosidase
MQTWKLLALLFTLAGTMTAGAAEQLKLAVDRAEIQGDGRDLAFVTVTVADKDGLLVPRTHNLVKFSVSGPGEIVAVGNGDAASHEPFIAEQRKAFNGLCLAIIRAKRGTTGDIKLTAESENLRGASLTIRSRE